MRGKLLPLTWQHDPTLYAPPRYRKACRYEAFVPDPISKFAPMVPSHIASVISDAESAIARLNAHASPALAPLARLLLRTESIASSKVEGMQVDARTLATAEAAQDTGRRIGVQAAEILANVDAMQFAIETATSSALSITGLTSIHKLLLEQARYAGVAGMIRERQNWIGGTDYNPCGADFVPPPPEEVSRLMVDLCSFCNRDDLPPIVQAAIAHAQFETIHPFADGNGRTGRALIQLILRRRGLAPSFVPPISLSFARDKARYIRGLESYRKDDMNAWLEMFATSAVQATSMAASYLDAVAELQDRWRGQLRDRPRLTRADSVAWTIIDLLPAHPVISVVVGTVATGRTKPAVNNAIGELAEAGVLQPISDSRRNRAWEAVGLLDLIVAMDAD